MSTAENMRKIMNLMEDAFGNGGEEEGDWYNPHGAARQKEFRGMEDLDINDLIAATVDAHDLGGYTYGPFMDKAGEPSGEMTLDQGGTPVTVDYNGEPHGIYNLSDTEIVLISPDDDRTFSVTWNEVDVEDYQARD